MVPQIEDENYLDYELEQLPSLTYKVSEDGTRIAGYIDNVDAVKQAVYKQLMTERYKHLIYSWDYGVEINELYGADYDYVIAELTSTITEALMTDDRIISVEDFVFIKEGAVLKVKFTINTIYGNSEIETEVNV